MSSLALHEFHQSLNARFTEWNGSELVGDYGDIPAEHRSLHRNVGVLDLGFRGRICLTGADRVRFLHGQVTNDVNRLQTGQGCYAALVTAKGKMQSDVNIYCLPDELLLDIEPGLTEVVSRRLLKYVVADDVQVVDVARDYGLLSLQGPESAPVLRRLELFPEIPTTPFAFVTLSDGMLGELYLMNRPRLGSAGFDVFVPAASLGVVADRLTAAAKTAGGRPCGGNALEIARIEAGEPRFGADMDESNLPLECGIEERAVSYSKGCYIGQEIINRVHSFGHVTRALRGLRLADDLSTLPARGDRLFYAGKECGSITSAVKSPLLEANIALGYVRTEVNKIGTELTLGGADQPSPARIVALPFSR